MTLVSQKLWSIAHLVVFVLELKRNYTTWIRSAFLILQIVRILCGDPELARVVVNAGDEEGWAPLHSAVSSGHISAVEVLLEVGKQFIIIFLKSETLSMATSLRKFNWKTKTCSIIYSLSINSKVIHCSCLLNNDELIGLVLRSIWFNLFWKCIGRQCA